MTNKQTNKPEMRKDINKHHTDFNIISSFQVLNVHSI